MLDRFFRLSEHGTTVRIELLAGCTTFLTMAYIVFLQPAVLSGRLFGFDTGMDFDAVTTATCLSAALATLLMGLYANYPIAQAPGMGENFFFVFSVLPAAAGFASAWQAGLGVIFVSGVIFLLLSLAGVRERIIDSISASMKNAMAAGIGLFIAFIGLQNAGLITSAASIVSTPGGPVLAPGTLVKLNPAFTSAGLLVFFFGLFVTAGLHVRRVRGSILIGILASAALCVVLKLTAAAPGGWLEGSRLASDFTIAGSVVAAPPPLAPTLFKMDLRAAFSLTLLPFVVIFLFMDMFDTIGTLVGVAEQGGFIKDNRLPRANKALLSDAVGTVAGACMGTSTVTSFIESAAGVEQGGRTGLTAVFVGLGFLLALFFSPIIRMIGSYPPITAPALVIVGAMMIQNVSKVKWSDYSEAIPAFLTILGIPLTYSIADGLALGFISYPVVKILGGRAREVGLLTALLSALLIAYFVFVRVGA